MYTKHLLPGVGASLGIDRLLAALETIGRLHITGAAAPILMALFDAERASDYIAVAAMLRRAQSRYVLDKSNVVVKAQPAQAYTGNAPV